MTFAAEVDYLLDSEWAIEAEDILWRRTKLGLLLTVEQHEALVEYIAQRKIHSIPEVTKKMA